MKLRIIFAVLIVLIAIYIRNHIRGPYCEIVKHDMKGKVVIVTGSNTGIGLLTAKHLALMGAEVVLACRSLEKAKLAREWILKDTNQQNLKLVPIEVDLSSFASVKQFIKQIKQKYNKIDVLVNNAGVMRLYGEKRTTKDGIEEMMQVNHFSHFLITNELLELIKKSKSPRIINVSALAHTWAVPEHFFDLNSEKNYDNQKQYGKSKMANILFSLELQKRLNETSVCVSSLHPGVIVTELARDFKDSSVFQFLYRQVFSFFLKTCEQGAATQIKLASDPSIQNTCGRYWVDCEIGEEIQFAKNEQNAKKLWEMSEQILKKY